MCRCCRPPRRSRPPRPRPGRGSARSRCRRRRCCRRRCAARTPRAPRSCSRRPRDPRSARSAARPASRGRRTASDAGGRPRGARLARRISVTRRLVWLLPAPVRTAQMATHGFLEASSVSCGATSRKSAPAASAREAMCITCSCETSEYENTTSFACVLGDDLLELRLGPDRDAHRIPVPGQLVRVDAPLDVRDLGGRERDDLVRVRVAEEDVEVVEVAAGGADDDHARRFHRAESICSEGGRNARDYAPCVPKPCTHGAEKSPSPTRCSGAGRSTSSTCPASSRTSSSGGTCRPLLAGSSSSAPSLGSSCSTSAEPACRTALPGRRRSRRGWTTCALSWMQSARAARPCSASRKARP